MLRYLALIGLPLLLLSASPASAITAKQKMETCKFGADNEKLTGKKRTAFIHKCMGRGNYQPKARKDEMKKEKAMKKPAAKKKAAMKKPAAKKKAAMKKPMPKPADNAEKPKQ
jgi:hypothetical protein